MRYRADIVGQMEGIRRNTVAVLDEPIARPKLSIRRIPHRLSAVTDALPPDSGRPPHVHEREDEAFCVLEGALSVRMGEEEEREAPAGSLVLQPRGIRTPWGPLVKGPGRC